VEGRDGRITPKSMRDANAGNSPPQLYHQRTIGASSLQRGLDSYPHESERHPTASPGRMRSCWIYTLTVSFHNLLDRI
jgi:hypothetical protein